MRCSCCGSEFEPAAYLDELVGVCPTCTRQIERELSRSHRPENDARFCADYYAGLCDQYFYAPARAAAETDALMTGLTERRKGQRRQRRKEKERERAIVAEVLEGLPEDLQAIMRGEPCLSRD